MSSQINKRKPPNRSCPTPVFFFIFFCPRGLAVTFLEDKAVTKVTHAHTHTLPRQTSLSGQVGRASAGVPRQD